MNKKTGDTESGLSRLMAMLDERNDQIEKLTIKLNDAKKRAVKYESDLRTLLEENRSLGSRLSRIVETVEALSDPSDGELVQALDRCLTIASSTHKIVCHARGPRCFGCKHYRGEAPVCELAEEGQES